MKLKAISAQVLIFVLLFVAVAAGPVKAANDNDTIVLAECNWPGIRAKNAVAAHILETIGYNVDSKMVSDPVAHQGLASGRIDVHMGSWMPAMEQTREKMKDDIEVVAHNVETALYSMAVPQYVADAGVKSYNDLNKYAEKFDKKFYVGPTGWVAGETMRNAIEKDMYNLSGWEVQNSTQGALMAQIKKSINEKEWIVFVAWSPHWMNYVFDIKYLDDPENLWGKQSRVDTLVRKGFKEENPQAYNFFEQYKVGEVSNEWIYKVEREDKKPEQMAKKWIKNNPDKVAKWLEGVKASNGEDAFKVLKKELNIN